MNAHALAVLEFQRALDVVADRAATSLGAAHVRALRPLADPGEISERQRQLAALRTLAEEERGWTSEAIPELAGPLERLRVIAAVWSGTELLGAATLLASSRKTRAALEDDARSAVARGVLAPFADRLLVARKLEEEIARAIETDGSVRDDASPQLRRLRRELRASQGELIKLLERIMTRLEPQHAVPDMSVTIRNGRYVIPIRREGRGAVGGIVQDTSGSGATLFIEPPAAVEFGNRIRELEAEEREEVERILAALTDQLRPHAAALAATLETLIELDSLQARVRYGREFRGTTIEVGTSPRELALVEGRHPLLLAQGAPVIPFDLTLGEGEHTMLVSGPNTGGKTVLLKALGLMAALTQSGVPVPVAAGSRLPLFDDLFADIGDEQSIEASLSTFSAHLKNLSEVLRGATSRSLVLIDELGSGTDPVEGAALGGAILETLTRRGTLTVATTHLGELKQLAAEQEGVVNASLQFDAVQLAPTYRLIKGIPGRSYGLSIARRLRLPEEVIARAEERLPTGERDVAVLLTELERREAELAEREREARRLADGAAARAAALEERERELRIREKALERESRAEARRFLLDARAEVEKTIRQLRADSAAEMDAAARAARQEVERLAAEQGGAIEQLEREEARSHATPAAGELAAGDTVTVETLGGKVGKVIDLRPDDAVVAVGSLKLTVPRSTLRRVVPSEVAAERAVALIGDLPEVEAPREVDLRGQRVDEVETSLYAALDAAVRADFGELRIIHGKGTGALRDRVAELLRKDVRVKSFRLGAWNEGGTGVTVAMLR